MHAVLSRLLLVALAVGTVACESEPAAPAPAATTAAAPETPADDAPIKLNMDELFPAGEGRDLVLNNCQTCHNFVPILTLQMDAQQWDRNRADHKERVNQLTDAQVQSLYDYLKKTFNPQRPVPKLPKEMLDSWTSY